MSTPQDRYDALQPATRRLIDTLDGIDLMPLRSHDRVQIENAIRNILMNAYNTYPASDVHDSQEPTR